MPAVVALREDRVGCVPAFEHAGGVRHPDDQTLPVALRGLDQRTAGVELKGVVYHLHAVDRQRLQGVETFLFPPDRRPECHAG